MNTESAQPLLSQAVAELTESVRVIDEKGESRVVQIACERPLTIYLNKREIVTLMTLGRRSPKRWCWGICVIRDLSIVWKKY